MRRPLGVSHRCKDSWPCAREEEMEKGRTVATYLGIHEVFLNTAWVLECSRKKEIWEVRSHI